jgi:hypothetical protein
MTRSRCVMMRLPLFCLAAWIWRIKCGCFRILSWHPCRLLPALVPSPLGMRGGCKTAVPVKLCLKNEVSAWGGPASRLLKHCTFMHRLALQLNVDNGPVFLAWTAAFIQPYAGLRDHNLRR